MNGDERYPIEVMTVPERPTAVLTATTTWSDFPDLWRPLLDEVWANITWGGTGRKGRNVMLYLDDTPRVEIGVELDQPAQLAGRIVRSHLPAGDAAMTTHRGTYEELGLAHEAVQRWCADNRRSTAGPRWEIYGHVDPDTVVPEIEVWYLLA